MKHFILYFIFRFLFPPREHVDFAFSLTTARACALALIDCSHRRCFSHAATRTVATQPKTIYAKHLRRYLNEYARHFRSSDNTTCLHVNSDYRFLPVSSLLFDALEATCDDFISCHIIGVGLTLPKSAWDIYIMHAFMKLRTTLYDEEIDSRHFGMRSILRALLYDIFAQIYHYFLPPLRPRAAEYEIYRRFIGMPEGNSAV